MSRPELPPRLLPRRPETVLGWSMQKLRIVHGWSTSDIAAVLWLWTSHVSRVEHGKMPAAELVDFYEPTFAADGLLKSLYAATSAAPSQERLRLGGRWPKVYKSLMGDESTFLEDTVPPCSVEILVTDGLVQGYSS
jgi:transcriptional regulator with XRE-family HTH domain